MRVSRAVYTEALDAFFEVNIFHLEREELFAAVIGKPRWAGFVRDLAVDDIIVGNGEEADYIRAAPAPRPSHGALQAFGRAVEICLGFPKLRTLTITGDYGTGFSEYIGAVLVILDTNERPYCVDVGLYRLGDKQLAKVYFQDRRLYKAWSRVKAAGQIDILEAWYDADVGISDWFDEIGLETWCAIYDRWRGTSEVEICENERLIIKGFHTRLQESHRSWDDEEVPDEADWTYPDLGADVCLRVIDPEVHGAAVVQWLTTLIKKCLGNFEIILEE